MTARSRAWFWALTSVLALLLLLAGGLVGHRVWQVEEARRSVVSRNVDVRFAYHGPGWLEPVLPELMANAWFSVTFIHVDHRDMSRPRFDDRDWQAILPDIKRLPDLVVLGFWQTAVGKSTLDSLADFPRLDHLSVVDSHLTDEELRSLHRYPQLYALNVSRNAITDAGLQHLTSLSNLHELTLDSTQVTEEGLVHLRTLKHLKELSLVNTGLPESALMSLEANLPGLIISDD